MGIELLDHVIVTRSDHASMARLGLMGSEAPSAREAGEAGEARTDRYLA